MAVKNVKKVVFAYKANTQVEFETSVMASAIKAGIGLGDIDAVDNFYQAIKLNAEGFCSKGKAYAQVALTHNYQTIFTLAETVSKDLNLQFTDKSYRAGWAETTRLKAIKALKAKPKTKHTCYVTELNTAELAVMPIRIMPNIYFGFYNSGDSYEYKRKEICVYKTPVKNRKEKVKAPKKVETVAMKKAKAQKADARKEAQKALIKEYNHKVKALFGFQKYCA